MSLVDELNRQLRLEASILVAYALLYQEDDTMRERWPDYFAVRSRACDLLDRDNPSPTYADMDMAIDRLKAKGYMVENSGEGTIRETKNAVIHFNRITRDTGIEPEARVRDVSIALRVRDVSIALRTLLGRETPEERFAERMRDRRQRSK